MVEVVGLHIAITGNLGSGKSTICRYLSEKYGFTKYSTGDVQRRLAQNMKMTTLELNLFMHGDAHYDNLIDDEVVKIAIERSDEAVIFDSRMAWHFVPSAFKVFLAVDLQVAARRVYTDAQRGTVEAYSSLTDTYQKLQDRANSERERFLSFYHVDYFNLSQYDLVVDTSHSSAIAVAELIYREATRWANATQPEPLVLLSPQSIYPPLTCEITTTTPGVLLHPGELLVQQYRGGFYLACPEQNSALLAACQQKDDFLRATLLPEAGSSDSPDHTLEGTPLALTLEDIHRWEELAGFTFASYPSWLI